MQPRGGFYKFLCVLKCADERGGSFMLQLQAWCLPPQHCQQRWLPGVLLHGSHSAVLQLVLVPRCCKACRYAFSFHTFKTSEDLNTVKISVFFFFPWIYRSSLDHHSVCTWKRPRLCAREPATHQPYQQRLLSGGVHGRNAALVHQLRPSQPGASLLAATFHLSGR